MKHHLVLILIIVVVIIIALLGLGRVSYKINPLSRYLLLQQFISQIKKDDRVDAEKFWEFRDFYGAGILKFAPVLNKRQGPFLTLKTPTIESYDTLTPPRLRYMNPDRDTYTLTEDKCTVTLIFEKPIWEMRQANGHFAYYEVENDKVKLDGYTWNNKTIIQKPWCD